jgi:hypothetical protein
VEGGGLVDEVERASLVLVNLLVREGELEIVYAVGEWVAWWVVT